MRSTASSWRHRQVRALRPRLTVEPLEARNLLDGSLANILVNDPNLDQPALLTLPDGSTTIRTRDTQSETALVLGSDNRVIVAYNDTGSETYGDGISQLAGFSISTNGGGGFEDRGALPDNAYGFGSDPVLARSDRTGTVFLSTITVGPPSVGVFTGRINIFRSLDDGQHFEQPVNGTPGFIPGVDQQDKPWIAVDNYPGPGFGNVYLTWNLFTSENERAGIYLSRSVDDGVTWVSADGKIAPGGNTENGWQWTQDPYVTVGPDHAVYVFWYDYHSQAIRMCKSTDHGATSGDAVTVSGVGKHSQGGDLGLTDASGNVFRADPAPQAVVNPATGDIYLVYADNPKGSKDRADIYFVQSSDGGQTWSPRQRINDDSTLTDQWQPALTLTPDGSHVGIFWYDRRLDPVNNNLIDRFGVIGTVSGSAIAFGENFRITDVSFPPAFGQDLGIASNYMGDYDQAVADNKFFYTTWGDNRLANPNYAPHVNQPDVRFAKIPVTGNGGAAALSATGVLSTLTEPPAGQSNAGTNVPSHLGIDLRITDVLGTTLGPNAGNSIWVDDDDPKLYAAVDQSERNRTGLLTMLEHETRHTFGFQHEDKVVTIDPRSADTQLSDSDQRLFDVTMVGWLPIVERLKPAGQRKE